MSRFVSEIVVNVLGIIMEFVIQVSQVPCLGLNPVSTEKDRSVSRIRMIYHMISN